MGVRCEASLTGQTGTDDWGQVPSAALHWMRREPGKDEEGYSSEFSRVIS